MIEFTLNAARMTRMIMARAPDTLAEARVHRHALVSRGLAATINRDRGGQQKRPSAFNTVSGLIETRGFEA